MKQVRLYGRTLRVTGAGGELDETYRHLPTEFDLVDPVFSALARHVAPDSVCVDVGAGFGLHTLALAVLAREGHVVAVEPSPQAFASLEQNVVDNGLRNVSACRRWPGGAPALGAPFLDPAITRAASTTATAGSTEAPTTTVDQLVGELDLAKVDVLRVALRGAELGVLDGARRTLEEWHPVVLVVFNSFDIAVRHGTLPHVALARLRDLFPYCYALDRADGVPKALRTDVETDWFLYDNSSHGPVDDLMCTFEPLDAPGYAHHPLLPSAGEMTTVVSQRDQAREEAAALREENELLRRRNEELERAKERAVAEVDAMRATVSWRLTSPLRQARSRAGRRVTDEGSEPQPAVDPSGNGAGAGEHAAATFPPSPGN